MPFNPNPLTSLQERLLQSIRKKLVEIRKPDQDIDYLQDYEFYIEHTKKFGDIPKIRFRPNSLAMKEEIMQEIGYVPLVEKSDWRAFRNAAASAFDKHWDNMIFRLVKGARLLAQFNQMLSEDGQEVSELIRLVQHCIQPLQMDGRIKRRNYGDAPERKSYMEELREVEQK
jgi:hypothetical protein